MMANLEQEFADLKKQVQVLQKELSRVADEAEVRKVHFKYGYYLDKCLYNEVVDMFSDHPDAYVEFLGGRYRGKEGIARLYQGRFQQQFVAGRNGPVHGWLLDHIMMQEIVDVDPTGTHAWCRMRALMQAGTHQSIEEEYPWGHKQWWEGGLYENEYIKENGVWKLFRYRYFPFWHADFERGWSHTKKGYVPWPTKTFPEDPKGPDELLEQKVLWPDTRVVPFHYPHPVTGKAISPDDLRAPRYGKSVLTADPPLVLDLPKGIIYKHPYHHRSIEINIMAHIFTLAPSIDVTSSPYQSSRLAAPGKSHRFPSTDVFRSMNAPSRLDSATILNLEVTGQIPPEINGTFFRVQPDHRFPPLYEDDIHFNGDGSVTAIRIFDGKADFRQSYVHTERYKRETAARRALFGRYRNPYTDNESVKGVIRTASNTNVVFWRGVLLAMKEDGPPYAMDPETLETLGRYDFEGQITAPTFTAHPKFDPETGEMVCFAYEAGGDGADCSVDVAVWTVDKDGRKTEEAWYKAPFAGMIHDCGLSENYLVLALTPIKMNLERMKRGGNKFAWDPEEDQWYAVVPRRGGKSEDIVWFRADNGFHGHVAGCYELASGEVVFDLTVADGNVFFFFPPDTNLTPLDGVAKRNKLSSPTVRWIFDPKAKKSKVHTPEAGDADIWVADERVTPALTWLTNGEFSRIDDRYVTKPYRHFWQAVVDPTKPYDFAKCGPPAGGLFNCLGHYTWSEDHYHTATSTNKPASNGLNDDNNQDPKTENRKYGLEDVYFPGPTTTFQEPTFIPKNGGAEGEGWLIALLNHLDVLRNDVVIFDAQNLSQGPLAVIHLPLKLKLGLHGNWVDNRDIEDWKRRRAGGGDVGPVQVASEPLPWQKKLAEQVNGH
ncbi:putative carotenoid oxygenase protein [Cladorrhinum samala]|uniref:Carotenoid oxygenase protein n=1 Tax=Cladorrhinum samala TaxID=585594 RepID=A0AAV9HI73_9PEZI|nr:putative carotenoid oxygenase protein [Cladorrhinum samala]